MAYRRFPGQRPIARPMPPAQPMPRRMPMAGMGRMGACAAAVAASCGVGVTGGVSGPVPPQMGGNSIQGRGIVFTYSTPFTPGSGLSVAPAATGSPQVIQFDANSVFVWLRSTFTATIAHAAFLIDTIPIPNLLVNIQDTGKGASFMNTPVPVWQIASLAPGLPYVLPVPQLIQANASFQWTFTNYDAAVTYADIQFQLHGFRVFDPTITDISQIF